MFTGGAVLSASPAPPVTIRGALADAVRGRGVGDRAYFIEQSELGAVKRKTPVLQTLAVTGSRFEKYGKWTEMV